MEGELVSPVRARPGMTLRAVLLLVGYLLLFPPLFVLGPLAGLLIASRPKTVREWMWIGAAGVWLLLSLWQSGGIAPQMMQAWPFFVTTAFVALMLAGRRSLTQGALLATLFAMGGATGWIWALGTRWHDIQLAIARFGWEWVREFVRALGPDKAAGMQVALDAMADGVSLVAQVYPAVLILSALPGLAIAWSWYHGLANAPIGAPAGRFAEFRFSDQLVWGVVLAVAALVLPVPPPLQLLLGNIALVVGGLYVARGAAIIWGGIETFPIFVLGVIALGIIVILPVVLGGTFALGLADTWVDFRRRFAAASERSDPWK